MSRRARVGVVIVVPALAARQKTDEHSRNNVYIAIVSAGEGWHNNHHADPRSAKHGHRWWELDVTYLIIRFLAVVGLARNVVMPKARLTAGRARTIDDPSLRRGVRRVRDGSILRRRSSGAPHGGHR